MNSFSKSVIRWYKENKRALPWREQPDPYWVWVSEIMAQQTRLDTIIPYFLHWMQKFPSIAALAKASEQEILKMWEGLGYYNRARNLLKTAQILVETYQGQLPQTTDALQALPGIGPYTAGAIASLAFGHDEAVVDGNVKRVFSRYFNLQEPVNTTAAEKKIWSLATQHLPSGQAADYNQGLMDLGAMVCTPKNPACQHCPLSSACEAYQHQLQDQLPVKNKKPAAPHFIVTAAILQTGNQVLIAKRPASGLLPGMWEFPGGKQEEGENLSTCLQREIMEELGLRVSIGKKLGVYKHAYSHFKVTLHAFFCRPEAGVPSALEADDIKWVDIPALSEYPMGKIDREISKDLLQLEQRLHGT